MVRRKQKLESALGGRHRNRVYVNNMTLHKIADDGIVVTLESVKEERG